MLFSWVLFFALWYTKQVLFLPQCFHILQLTFHKRLWLCIPQKIQFMIVPALYMLVPLIFMFALFLYINRPVEADGIIIETEEAIDFSENNDRLITAPFIILVIIFIFSLFS